MISCPGCGQGMRFEPKLQMMYCDYCDTKLDPEGVTAGEVASEDSDHINFESTLYTCPQCGGEILSDNDTAVTFCSYCGLSVELKGRTVKMQAPTKVIPFKCTKEACTDSYKKFIKKAIYAPSYLRNDTNLEKIRGIYMPYWSYRMNINANTCHEGTTSHRSGDYIITDTYGLYARPEGFYDGISYDASSSFSDELSQAVGPFNVRESKPFSVAYISGFYADTADVDAHIYEDDAKVVVASDIDLKIRKIPDFSRYSPKPRPEQIIDNLRVTNKEMSYFPVYFLANRHKNGLVSYAAINGQTGKVAADVPIDYKKYILGSILLALPIMVGLDFFLVLRPDALIVIALIFALISMLISNSELNLIYTRDLNLNDQGLLDAEKKRREEEKRRQAEAIMLTGESEGAGSSVNIPKADPSLSLEQIKKKSSIYKAVESAVPTFGTLSLAVFFVSIEAGESFILVFAALFLILTVIAFFVREGLKKSLDKSMVSIAAINAKQPFKEKLPVLIKPIIAMVLGAILFIIKPYQDIVNYIFCFIIMGIVIFTFSDVVRLHNKLTLRKPKQFNKRGGDENAEVL